MLPQGFLRLLNAARLKDVPEGQIVHYQGDTELEIHVIKSGVIKMYEISVNGDEKILHLLDQHALVPLSFFNDPPAPNNWFYATLTECQMWVIRREDLRKLFLSDPETCAYLTNWFSREVHEILVRLESFGKSNSEEKLIAALKFLATRHATQNSRGWYRVNFPISHQILADLIGITRESTSHAMKQLTSQNVIRNPRMGVLEIRLDELIKES